MHRIYRPLEGLARSPSRRCLLPPDAASALSCPQLWTESWPCLPPQDTSEGPFQLISPSGSSPPPPNCVRSRLRVSLRHALNFPFCHPAPSPSLTGGVLPSKHPTGWGSEWPRPEASIAGIAGRLLEMQALGPCGGQGLKPGSLTFDKSVGEAGRPSAGRQLCLRFVTQPGNPGGDSLRTLTAAGLEQAVVPPMFWGE